MKKTILSLVLMALTMNGQSQEAKTQMTKAYQQSAFELFNAVAKNETDNVCFSPLSVQIALSMVQNGAAGNTLSQLQQALGTTGLSNEEIGAFNKQLAKMLTARPAYDEEVFRNMMWNPDGDPREVYDGWYPQCELANALWTRPYVHLYDNFVQSLRNDYDAGVDAVNFDTWEGIEKINGWVSDHTHGLIPKLYDEPQSSDLAVVLMNALYFKGSWSKPFAPELTEQGQFFLNDETYTTVDMMLARDVFQCAVTPSFQTITMDYGANGDYSMTIFLPYKYEASIFTEDDFEWEPVFEGSLTSTKVELLGDRVLYRGKCVVTTDNADKRFEEAYGTPYILSEPYAEGYDLVFFVKNDHIIIPQDFAEELEYQKLGINMPDMPLYGKINESSSTFAEDKVVLDIDLVKLNAQGEVDYSIGYDKLSLTNYTWDKVATGTYYYMLFSEVENAYTPDPGYELYKRTDNENVYKIKDWLMGTDFIFTWDKVTNKCVVLEQPIEYTHGNFGSMYVIEGALYDSERFGEHTSFYNPETKIFHFFPVYYVSVGHYGQVEELFEITNGGGVKKMKPIWNNAQFTKNTRMPDYLQGSMVRKKMHTRAITLGKKKSKKELGTTLPPLTYEDWNAAQQQQYLHVNLYMPRFEIDGKYDLKTVLKGMGVTDAFDEIKVDFTKMSEVNRAISSIYQLSKIIVDEKGTEAAALTLIEEATGIDLTRPEDYQDFKVDRPFYFTIQNRTTNTILFAGRVNHFDGPTGKVDEISTNYRHFVEEGKVWLTGIPDEDLQLFHLRSYTIVNDTIIGKHQCKKLMCKEWLCFDDPASVESNYIGALYEEGLRTYFIKPSSETGILLYDFNPSVDDNILIDDGFGNQVSYTVVQKAYSETESFKGLCMKLQTSGPLELINTWMEGVGNSSSPLNNIHGECGTSEEELITCTVNDEVLYYNERLIIIFSDSEGSSHVKKNWLDFTHTVKTRPKGPRRVEAESDEEALTGEYSIKELFVNFKTLTGPYTITVTNAAKDIIYNKVVQTSNVVALNTDISTYPKGSYTITIENENEVYSAEFNIKDEDGLSHTLSPVKQGSIYNLKGQRLTKPQRGVNIVNGHKVVVK